MADKHSAEEFLGKRGLADLSIHWPAGKPIPQRDYKSGEVQPTLLQLMADYAALAVERERARNIAIVQAHQCSEIKDRKDVRPLVRLIIAAINARDA